MPGVSPRAKRRAATGEEQREAREHEQVQLGSRKDDAKGADTLGAVVVAHQQRVRGVDDHVEDVRREQRDCETEHLAPGHVERRPVEVGEQPLAAKRPVEEEPVEPDDDRSAAGDEAGREEDDARSENTSKRTTMRRSSGTEDALAEENRPRLGHDREETRRQSVHRLDRNSEDHDEKE